MTRYIVGGWLLRTAQRTQQVLANERVTFMLVIVIVAVLVWATGMAGNPPTHGAS